MTIESALRCGHCLDRLDESDATEVAGSLVCPRCAWLASASERERATVPSPVAGGTGRPRARARRDAPGLSARLRQDLTDWCTGRWWIPRAPFALFFAWIWMRHAADPTYRSPFGGLNLGVHELGHFVFAPFGDLPSVFGGSLLQCLVPVLGAAMFVRQRDYFAVAFAAAWFATNCFEVATYAGDAVRMQLPLVTPGGGHPIHDWNYLLGAKGWLRHTDTIAAAYRASGHVAMAAGIGGMGWIVLKMIRSPGSRLSGAG